MLTNVIGSLPDGLKSPKRMSVMACPPDCPGYPTHRMALALDYAHTHTHTHMKRERDGESKRER